MQGLFKGSIGIPRANMPQLPRSRYPAGSAARWSGPHATATTCPEMPMARNIYSVSVGERPILVREAVQVSENVIFVDDEFNDPFALVVAESEGRAYEIGAPLFMFD
jgi:hypothetical protein